MCLIDLSDTRALDCSRGNALRLLNHSCRSNAFLRIIRERVEVYARRDIGKGEEITVDYGESPHSGGMRCGCGHALCRSRI
jgi:SET domain-containing protein